MESPYERPAIRDIGAVQDLTEQLLNKIGTSSDIISALTGGAIIGSLVPLP